jgi:hypothetical protein
MTSEPGTIKNKLYPFEWILRFFIGGVLVWIIGSTMPEPDPLFTVGFYVLMACTLAAVIWQVAVFMKQRPEQ